MKPLPLALRAWLLALLGAAFLVNLGWFQTGEEELAARRFAAAHAVPGPGMLVLLYDNPFLTGRAQASVQPPPRLHQDETAKPLRRHPFAWRWLAHLQVPQAGTYVLDVFAAEAVNLYLDGVPLIRHWNGSPPQHRYAVVDLEAGGHLLDLRNVQRARRLDLSLMWMPPGSDRQVIPASLLRPLDANTPPAELDRLYEARLRWLALTWLLPTLWLLMVWLVLAKPGHARKVLWEHRWFLAVLALAGVLRLAWGATVPGVAGESAYFIHRAQLIIEGALPFNGMNTRVGPLWDYLLVPWVAVLGPSAWLLRAAGAAANLLALVFCYRVCRREAGRQVALAACLVLAVLPAAVAYARMPGESTALGPLALFIGLDLLSLSRRRPPLAALAGVVWGLAAFNHSIFFVVPATLGGAALVVSRLRILKEPRLYGLMAGFGLGLLPRIYDRLLNQPRDVMSFTDPDRLDHATGFLQMFARALDGRVVYKLFTGHIEWNTWWLIPIILGLAGLYLLWGVVRRRPGRWPESWLGLALIFYLCLVPLGAPSANPRYYLFAYLYTALLAGIAFARLHASPRLRPLAVGGLGLFCALCLASLGVNYFWVHITTNGRPHNWGSDPLMDHSADAWMNHKPLADELRRRGYPVVATGDYWHHTLDLTLNLYQDRPKVFHAVPITASSDTERAAVFYRSPEGKERMKYFLATNPGIRYKEVPLGSDLDESYVLLERVSPPVRPPAIWKELR